MLKDDSNAKTFLMFTDMRESLEEIINNFSESFIKVLNKNEGAINVVTPLHNRIEDAENLPSNQITMNAQIRDYTAMKPIIK